MPDETEGRKDGYLPIAAYGAIGDCHTAALVGRDGAIDWYCPVRFDAPAVFCRLLDADKGGYFAVAPAGDYRSDRRYRGETNILETDFHTGSGRLRLTDFMPVRQQAPGHAAQDGASGQILRLVEGIDGEVEFELFFKPTFDFAHDRPCVDLVDGGAIATDHGKSPSHLIMACPRIPLEYDASGGVHGRRRLRANERCWIAVTHLHRSGDPRDALSVEGCDDKLQQTDQYWNSWAAACTYRGAFRSLVLRSALALKLLTYEPTGAIIAAPTTSLPEMIGGVRNWDYRYAWLRDTSLLIYALMALGYQESAGNFFHWLCRTQAADRSQPPEIMYTIDEKSVAPEVMLSTLSGYRGSRPVRVGNAASKQLQLDVFGEVLTAAHLHFRHESKKEAGPPTPADRRLSSETWTVLRSLVEQAARRWQEPDKGIWEMRGGVQRFLYSRLMCWAALDRGIQLAEDYRLPAPLDAWYPVRDAIREAILTQGYNEQEGAFTQAFGSTALDASALVIPRIGFLSPTDPRVRSTIKRIQADLTRNDLVYRYRTVDGLPGGEGAFVPCSFWLVQALALSGQVDEAQQHFEQLAAKANDLGLFAEEIDVDSGALLGNFPQGFSHAAVINAAVDLAKASKHGAEEQPETQAQRAQRAPRARRAAQEGQGNEDQEGRIERRFQMAVKPTWKPHTEHGEVSSKEREELPDSVFAFPKQRKEPLTDASHVKNALARFDQVEGVSDSDRDLAFANIKAAAKHYGIDVEEKDWHELGKQPHTKNPAHD